MTLYTMHTGPLDVNTYFMYGKKDNECIVFDPSDAKKVERFLVEKGLKLTHVFLTHGHFDHTIGVADLQKDLGAKVVISELDAAGLYDDSVNLCVMGMFRMKHCYADMLIKDGMTVEAAGFSMKVVATPGHTVGSVCYIFEEERVIIAGDTLFNLSIGRSDLPGGNSRDLFESITERLYTLPGDYGVYPGHMASTTLLYEKKNNPFTKHWSPELW